MANLCERGFWRAPSLKCVRNATARPSAYLVHLEVWQSVEKDSKWDSTPHLETLIHQTLKICGKMAFASASALFRRLVNWTTVVACRHLMCSLSLPCSGRILANLVDCCCSRFGNLITCVKQRQSFRISGSLHCPPHPHSLCSRRRSRSH